MLSEDFYGKEDSSNLLQLSFYSEEKDFCSLVSVWMFYITQEGSQLSTIFIFEEKNSSSVLFPSQFFLFVICSCSDCIFIMILSRHAVNGIFEIMFVYCLFPI